MHPPSLVTSRPRLRPLLFTVVLFARSPAPSCSPTTPSPSPPPSPSPSPLPSPSPSPSTPSSPLTSTPALVFGFDPASALVFRLFATLVAFSLSLPLSATLLAFFSLSLPLCSPPSLLPSPSKALLHTSCMSTSTSRSSLNSAWCLVGPRHSSYITVKLPPYVCKMLAVYGYLPASDTS